MKKIITILFSIIITITLVSCGGYNNIMYNHLSDIENYFEISGILKDIYYFNDFKKISWDESTNTAPIDDRTIYFSLQFDEEEYMKFFGYSSMSEDFDYAKNYVIFEIIPSNASMIIENSFFEFVSYGDVVTIITSDWIYMDTNFYMVIELEHKDSIYLPVDTGLNNLISYMKENHSIF